jgi:hypothetical protein
MGISLASEGLSLVSPRHFSRCTCSGLTAEPEKTEVLFFRRQREQEDPPSALHLRIPAEQTYYRVKPSTNVQHLGFFINHRLTWTRHVNIMCNRA